MEESSEENYPASAVFNNQILVQTILEHVTNDIRNNMSFRLVNKTFKNSCHAMLRKNHQKVKIEYIPEYYEEALREYNENHIYVNYRPVKLSNVKKYFHLIKNVANVKVDSIYVKNLFLLTKEKQKIVHDSITRTLIGNDRETIKTLIGMDDICEIGCENCAKIPGNCLEYGPIRIKNLRKSFAEPRFFEKLFIADYFLDNIANNCVKSSTTKEKCLNAIEKLINSEITCRTLVLKITETRKMDSNSISFTYDKFESMPREVLEIILKKWKVQSLILKFVAESRRPTQAGNWISKNWFSILCLNDDYRHVRRSGPDLKISNVCIDFKDSFNCARTFQAPIRDRIINPYRYNIVANVRRVFSCDRISIECSHWYQRLGKPIAEGVERFMELITKEAKDNLEVNIRMFPTHRNSREVFNGFIEKKYSDPDFYRGFRILPLPSPLPVFLRSLEPIGEYPYCKLKKKEWIGDAFRMTNRRQKLTIDWEFMIEKEEPRRMNSYLGPSYFERLINNFP